MKFKKKMFSIHFDFNEILQEYKHPTEAIHQLKSIYIEARKDGT